MQFTMQFKLLNFEQKSNITYQYGLPNGYQQKNFNFFYEYNQEWTSCSKSCGKGLKQMHPNCMELVLGQVDDLFCLNISKLEILNEPCNIFECSAKYKGIYDFRLKF